MKRIKLYLFMGPTDNKALITVLEKAILPLAKPPERMKKAASNACFDTAGYVIAQNLLLRKIRGVFEQFSNEVQELGCVAAIGNLVVDRQGHGQQLSH